MGYYIYNMEVLDHDRFGKEIAKPDIDLLEAEVRRMNVFGGGSFGTGWYSFAKWDDFEKDMILLSTMFPDMIFYLGESVEGGGDDLWGTYYSNGMAMYGAVEIVYHPFDPLKLERPSVTVANTFQYQEGL